MWLTKLHTKQLLQFNRELDPLKEVLLEYPVTFAPSYPYEEEPDLPQSYMATRCPAWCDRILMNVSAKDLIVTEMSDAESANEYDVIGNTICMGDHKVLLNDIYLFSFQVNTVL